MCTDDIRKAAEEVSPSEAYSFCVSPQEYNEVMKEQQGPVGILSLLMLSLIGMFILIGRSVDMPQGYMGFICGMMLFSVVLKWIQHSAYKRSWLESKEKACKTLYRYEVFDTYMTIALYRNAEKLVFQIVYFQDIQRMQVYDRLIAIQIANQLFFLRKEELQENSFFLTYLEHNPAKVRNNTRLNNWKFLSFYLFIGIVCVLFMTYKLIDLQFYGSLVSGRFWVGFPAALFPIGSIFFWSFARHKGYNFPKNLVMGILGTVLLIGVGCLQFFF